MAFDEGLAKRIRALLDARSDVGDRRMFGGIAFLVAPGATADDGDLERWVRRGEAYAASLPPK